MVWLSVFGIFNVRTDVDAYDGTLGLYEHGESAQDVEYGIVPVSVFSLIFWSDALPTKLSLLL